MILYPKEQLLSTITIPFKCFLSFFLPCPLPSFNISPFWYKKKDINFGFFVTEKIVSMEIKQTLMFHPPKQVKNVHFRKLLRFFLKSYLCDY